MKRTGWHDNDVLQASSVQCERDGYESMGGFEAYISMIHMYVRDVSLFRPGRGPVISFGLSFMSRDRNEPLHRWTMSEIQQ